MKPFSMNSPRRALAAALIAPLVLVFALYAALADPLKISAQEANAQAAAGELVLVDIRTRTEWLQTGIAEPAHAISMHEAGFLEKLGKLRSENPGKPVALICAVGGRSSFMQGELEKRGFSGILDVSEGMMGNEGGPGWIKRGLPLRRWDG